MPEIRNFHLIFLILLSVSPFIRPQHGAYIAPVIKFTTINGQGSNLLGVKGGWIINNAFVIGAEYYALNSNITQNWVDPYSGISPNIKFSTGGLNFEYIFIHEKMFSASAEIFLGRSEEHTSELQSACNLVCRLL